jgi:hypothetical protein
LSLVIRRLVGLPLIVLSSDDQMGAKAMNDRLASNPVARSSPPEGPKSAHPARCLRSGEGPLTEHITATQAQPPERVFMPLSRPPTPQNSTTSADATALTRLTAYALGRRSAGDS